MKGIIWSENIEFEKGLNHAAQAFTKRFGEKPAVIEVHRSKLAERRIVDGVEIIPVRNVLINDYFAREK